MPMCNDSLSHFFSNQLLSWHEVKQRYENLSSQAQHKTISFRNLPVEVVFNPSRSISTCAKVDKESISKRPCFLCEKNRPPIQKSLSLPRFENFEILVNPFPILNPHFTIVATTHTPQHQPPLEAMIAAATMFNDYLFFFNGANAGASAPDHLHFQAVKKEFVPFITSGNFPFQHKKFHLNNSSLPLSTLLSPCELNNPLQNTFVYTDNSNNPVIVYVPRKQHRPKCYFSTNENDKFLISPGALDIAGKIITVRESDFQRINSSVISSIYNDTCFL